MTPNQKMKSAGQGDDRTREQGQDGGIVTAPREANE